MSPNPPCSSQLSGTRSRVHRDLLPDNEPIRYEFADRLAGVGIRDFIDFIRIKPDFTLAAPNDGCGKSLLGSKVDPTCSLESVIRVKRCRVRAEFIWPVRPTPNENSGNTSYKSIVDGFGDGRYLHLD